MKISLDRRLSLCASFVRGGSRLADIGTDHGYLPIFLCKEGIIESALACDINPAPLSVAEENIREAGLENNITTALGNGLEPVGEDDADDIVIAGMGGELIADIISGWRYHKNPDKLFILQPMTKYEKLAAYLYENGFSVIEQKAARSGKKLYTVIAAKYTGEKKPADVFSCITGMLDPSDPLSREFLKESVIKLRKRSLSDPSLLTDIKRIEEYLNDNQ